MGILYKKKKNLYLLVTISEKPVLYKDSIINLKDQSAEPSAFGQNHPERVSFSSKQYKNTVYQNLNTIQPVGGEGRVQTH